jgi:hypothetical protein
LYAAVMEGAVERVRPKMMTVVAIMAGLLPIMWSTGTGSEVMSRIAAPMVGGMISSTVLTLIVIPAIYALVKEAWPGASHLSRLPAGCSHPDRDCRPDRCLCVFAYLAYRDAWTPATGGRRSCAGCEPLF